MKELHHIVPRNMGGGDEEENTIWLSPRAHAIMSAMQSEHYGECCFHNRQLKYLEGELEWLGKRAIEICNRSANKKLAAKLRDPEFNEKFRKSISEGLRKAWQTKEYREKTVPKVTANLLKAREAAMTEEGKEKRRKKSASMKHYQKGVKSSWYGTMWITDGTKEGSKRIKKGSQIPSGFRPGRVMK